MNGARRRLLNGTNENFRFPQLCPTFLLLITNDAFLQRLIPNFLKIFGSLGDIITHTTTSVASTSLMVPIK